MIIRGVWIWKMIIEENINIQKIFKPTFHVGIWGYMRAANSTKDGISSAAPTSRPMTKNVKVATKNINHSHIPLTQKTTFSIILHPPIPYLKLFKILFIFSIMYIFFHSGHHSVLDVWIYIKGKCFESSAVCNIWPNGSA